MPAPAFASAPLSEPVMQALGVGSVYAGSLQPVYGPEVLRAVAKHFEMHFDLLPTNFVIVLPVVASHFCSSLVGSVTCADTAVASRQAPVAAMTAVPNHFDMMVSLPLFGSFTIERASRLAPEHVPSPG